MCADVVRVSVSRAWCLGRTFCFLSVRSMCLHFVGQEDWDSAVDGISAVDFQNQLSIPFCHCIQSTPRYRGMVLISVVTGMGSGSQI